MGRAAAETTPSLGLPLAGLVEGNRYLSYLNGVPRVGFTDPQPESFDGYIALQLHSGGEGDMLFKEIYHRDLIPR